MNTKKIISIFAFAMLILTAYQCGDKATTASGTTAAAAAANAVKTSSTPVKNAGSFVMSGAITNAENLQLFFDKTSITNSNQVIDLSLIHI